MSRKKDYEQEQKILNEIIVKESNILALSPRDRILHPNETKLLMWMYYQFQAQNQNLDKPSTKLSFSVKDFFHFFNIKTSNGYEWTFKWRKGIRQMIYYFFNETTKEWDDCVLVPRIAYSKGTLTCEFHDLAIKHLLNLDKQYVSINLHLIKEFKNSRCLRLYEWLKAKIFDGHCRSETISLEALYKLLIIQKNNYQKFHDFKRWVLIPVINKLNQIEDFQVEVEYLRTGRKISHIKFTCANNREMINQDGKKYCTSCKIKSVVLKTSPQGDFWGCENYPRCKYKVAIKSKKNEVKQPKIQNVKQINKSNDYLKQAFAEQFDQNKDFQDDYLLTNYPQFDKLFHGIKRNSFNIIFSTTSAGKTAFALNLMMQLRNKNKPIRAFFYSLEMNKFDVDRRLFSIVSHVPLDELQAKKEIVKKSFDSNVNKFVVDDEKQTELDALIQKIKQHNQQQPMDLAIVDYLQILSFKKSQNNYEKVTQAARELQKISTELKITIIAISQTNRRADRREKGKPLELHHLLDSSVISQSADLIISLDSTISYHPDHVLCDVQKNRNGSTGKIEFNFNKQNMVFSELKEQ